MIGRVIDVCLGIIALIAFVLIFFDWWSPSLKDVALFTAIAFGKAHSLSARVE